MNGVTRWELSQQWIQWKWSVEVKIPPTRGKTERPRAPLLTAWHCNRDRYRAGSGREAQEARTLVLVEPTLRYHPYLFWLLTCECYPLGGQCLVGSLDWGGRLLNTVTEGFTKVSLISGWKSIARVINGIKLRLKLRDQTKSSRDESRYISWSRWVLEWKGAIRSKGSHKG